MPYLNAGLVEAKSTTRAKKVTHLVTDEERNPGECESEDSKSDNGKDGKDDDDEKVNNNNADSNILSVNFALLSAITESNALFLEEVREKVKQLS